MLRIYTWAHNYVTQTGLAAPFTGVYELHCSVCVHSSSTDQRVPTMPEQCRDRTLIVCASLGAVVAVLIVITVGAVVVTYSCCYILKRRECRKHYELEMTDSNLKAQLKGSVEKGDKCFNSPKRSKVKKVLLLVRKVVRLNFNSLHL